MRVFALSLVLAAGLVSGSVGHAWAQTPYAAPNSAGSAADAQGVALQPLPSPDLGENARPSSYMRAARGALAAGRVGEAQQALEMAQTRLLDRSVPLGQTRDLSANPTVRQISQALQALEAGDRATAMQHIQSAITSATSEGG